VQNIEQAWEAIHAGHFLPAVDFARRVLQTEPENGAAIQLLAIGTFQLGLDGEALAAYQRLTALQPTVAQHWQDLATAARASQQNDLAMQAYAKAFELGGDTAELHWNYGLLLWDIGEIPVAFEHLQQAYLLQPLDASIALSYARLCAETVRQEPALTALRAWRQWHSLAEEQLAPMSALALKLGEVDEAESMLRLALTLDPNDSLSKVRRAGLFERLNRLDEAEAALQAVGNSVVDVETDFELRATWAKLRQRRAQHEEALSLLEPLLSEARGDEARAELCFSKAKSLDALGRYDEVLPVLEDAHAAQMRQIAVFTPKVSQQLEPLRIADYDVSADDVRQWRDLLGETQPADPVFVVGFPRSGTTLLEQLLDAHHGLRSMDEQPYLQQAVMDILAAGVTYPEGLAALTEEKLTRVRAAYWQRVANRVTVPAGVRLVDKNPLNLLRLPAIQRLFPDARTILVIRHPCDVLLSCYMQHFRAPEFAALCRSLPRLAEGYVKAFDSWYRQQQILQSQVLELRYESMVVDVPGTARALCEFVDLVWDPRMLDPTGHAQRRGYISTPSYTQVIKPVTGSAINRWRCYEDAFAPLMPVLRPYLDRWGYEGV